MLVRSYVRYYLRMKLLRAVVAARMEKQMENEMEISGGIHTGYKHPEAQTLNLHLNTFHLNFQACLRVQGLGFC